MNPKNAWRLILALPGADRFLIRRWGFASPSPSGMAASARYCYAVWLTHFIHASESPRPPPPDPVVVEIGPGSSLGAGFAALLSGASRYYGLDVVEHATKENNLRVFDELVQLFQHRARVPDGEEFPRMKGVLQTHDFPGGALGVDRLRAALRPERLERLRHAAAGVGTEASCVVPWSDTDLQEESVDFVFSQYTMEHVDDLPAVYKAMSPFLRVGGVVSHLIGFGSHGITPEWNGHWAFGDFRWKFSRGRRLYWLNREPLSTHLALLRENGFEIIRQVSVGNDGRDGPSVSRSALARRFRHMSQDDFTCEIALVQAVKIR